MHPIDSTITFFKCPLRQLSTPHDNELVLTLEVGCYLMRHILVDQGSIADLLYVLALLCLGYQPNNHCNLRRILAGFNGTQTTSLGEVVFPVATKSVIALIPYTVIDEPSYFNVILGRTCHEGLTFVLSSNIVFSDPIRPD